MLANIIIMVLILGYCAFVIYKSVKNSKEGKHMGCAGCSGNCGSCGGCSGAAFKRTAQSSYKVHVWCGNHHLHCRNADLSGIPVAQEKKRTKKR